MRRIATFLLALGVTIGVVGVVGLAVGFRPSELPADLLDISVYKLVFVAAASVLAIGALVRRADRRRLARTALEEIQRESLASGVPVETLLRNRRELEREAR